MQVSEPYAGVMKGLLYNAIGIDGYAARILGYHQQNLFKIVEFEKVVPR
jgi:hypothetical protein